MRLFLILLVAAGIITLAIASLWRIQPSQYLAERLDAELPAVAGEDIEPYLEQYVSLGDEGLVSLVAALGHPREEVRETAETVLLEQLERWRQRPVGESSQKVSVLARLLVEQQTHRQPESAEATERIVNNLLLWPIDRSVVDGAELVMHCATLLNVDSKRVSPQTLVASEAERNWQNLQGELALSTPAQGNLRESSPSEPPARFRYSDAATDASAVNDAAPQTRAVEDKAPQTFQPFAEQTPVARITTMPDRVTEDPAPQYGLDDSSDLVLQPSIGNDLSLIDVASTAPQWKELNDMEIMSYLHAEQPADAIAAERELLRRGHRPLDVQIAKQAAHPDPAVRRRLAEQLPGTPGVNIRGWLNWLSRDSDATVRQTATAILSTSR